MSLWISRLIGTKLDNFWVKRAKFDSSALTANRTIKIPNSDITLASTSGRVSLSDGATITMDLSTGYLFKVTLGGNRALAVSNDADDDRFGIRVTQDGTGGRTLTLLSGATIKYQDSVTVNTGAGTVTYYSFERISSGVYACWRSTEV